MDARTAHLLLNFAEGAGPGLRGPEAKALFAQLEQQYGDLQLAMDWFVGQEQADEAFRLASSLVQFWMATKRLDEGSEWFNRVLALPGGDNARRGRASFDALALVGLARIAFRTENVEEARRLCREALAG